MKKYFPTTLVLIMSLLYMAGNFKWKKEKRKRFYVIFKGNQPRVYSSWDEYTPYVISFSGSLYNSFKTEDESVVAFYVFFDGNQNEERSSSVRSIGTSILNEGMGRERKARKWVCFGEDEGFLGRVICLF